MTPDTIRTERLEDLATSGAVLAIGNFDGVHRGHRVLLDRMRELATREALPSVILTFFPPAKVVFQGASYLTSENEKARLLASYEPTELAVLPFTKAFAQTDKQYFLDALKRCQPRAIVVGEDFRFGHNREGGLDDLQHVPDRLEVIRLKTEDGEPISSSRIRTHLQHGDVEAANALLGAPYLAAGMVIHGDHRGRTIGFPTANLDLPPEKALPTGVFAVTVDTPYGTFGGMANVGPRPTFPSEPPRLEAHLFDFDDDLYDQVVTVFFHAHLRGQRAFSGVDELKAQLAEDREHAQRELAARQLSGDLKR